MQIFKFASGSLARRFGLAAAALAAVAVLLTAVSSWWLISEQQANAMRELQQQDANYNAALVKGTLQAIHARLAEVANSTIIASGLVDSAGKETYLTPYLNGIRRINGIPIQILFTDFEGKEIGSNSNGSFNQEHIDWLKTRLVSASSSAEIFDGVHGPEVLAVELLSYSRSRTPEGALLYKFALDDIQQEGAAKLLWDRLGLPETFVRPGAVTVPVETPPIFQHLAFRVVKNAEPAGLSRLAPQYLVILLFAGGLAMIVLLLGSRLALALTRDLRRLESFSSDVVAAGFGAQRAQVSGSDEVASLARSFNHMLDRLYQQHNQLQEESTKLQQLANSISQLAWMADPDGTIHWYNNRWYEYTGTTAAEMAGNGWQRVHDPAVLPEVSARWQASLAAAETFQMMVPLRAADGSFRRFFTLVSPLRDGAGKVVQWFGTNTDVTALEEAEKAVRESEERLREGLKAGRMVVWDWDLVSGAIQFSDNAEDVFGPSTDNSEPGWGAVHPHDVEHLRDTADRALAEKGKFETCVRMVRADNHQTIWVEVRGSVVCDANGTAIMIRGISLDVTERKRAEDELRAADRRKDEFLAMLAHELRNPLAPISTAAGILKLVGSEDARIHKMSEIISRQVSHMRDLVDDLLDVSRVTRGLVTLEREPLAMAEVIADAMEQVRALMQARCHHLSLQGADTPVLVMADRTRLVQVLTNLLNNAAKFTPEGGQITLAVAVEEAQVRISVRDNGAGIAPELLPHIFDLFTQGERSPDRAQGGLGLGLALVKSLIGLHEGSVVAHSAGTGMGSEFIIRLPHLMAASPRLLQAPPGQATHAARPLRLMIVDDNADAAQSLAMLLQSAGHTVAVAYDALSGLELARRDVPEACLLDIGLPDIDGFELARRLRTYPALAGTVLIALTGYGHAQDRERSKAAGFDHHFLKPVDPSALASLLAEIGAANADPAGNVAGAR